ncbi:MAG TPA: glycoside hydrolase family 2 TIM barrel-domain containing protein [Terriglobia bacterium]|nr:glycoside hydrolase family 2 TIM barrel-domain containing protein [Terriglobia bacterium]
MARGPFLLSIGLPLLICFSGQAAMGERRVEPPIPLPEHPRPDFYRAEWMNLNGPWNLKFDLENVGESEKWYQVGETFPDRITVPFSWGSRLSGIEDKAPIAWYSRTLQVPESWKGKQVFLVVGACDWLTTGWLNGQRLGQHQGGYTPFEWNLTSQLRWGRNQQLVLRVDDTPHPFKLEGKQGYGPAQGIWQTIYLEARTRTHLQYIHYTPDIDHDLVRIHAALNLPAPSDLQFVLGFQGEDSKRPEFVQPIPKGTQDLLYTLPLANPRLWTLDDPFLYQVAASIRGEPQGSDRVETYFGMRKVSVQPLPGLNYPYIALNNKPIYLQMTLDQAYHPDGFYTFPSDSFMRDEILRARRIGLNAMRIHVKIECPRKLYWADRLGLLIMADIPNSWGEPDLEMRSEVETALQGMIRRDYNHPSIFSWVLFNETWGLTTKGKGYMAETQEWVAKMVHLAKGLDPTRLVEDNSACNYDHVVTDLNTWHSYLPGYGWEALLDRVSADTFPGSKWNFIGGRTQNNQPMLNSECGNVWGYEGSTGDVDWSWDYHIMMNEFRRHPKIAGWLYTEHHDVINEWNGYYRFDRSDKITGLDELVPGMSLIDWHSPFYVSTGSEICREVKPASIIQVPLYASFMTDKCPGTSLVLDFELHGWDSLGRHEVYSRLSRPVAFLPWMSQELPALEVTMPSKPALAILSLVLKSESGQILHRNFNTFLVTSGPAPRDETLNEEGRNIRLIRIAPQQFQSARWSLKQWNVLDGLKVNGAGSGYFEYRIPWPAGLRIEDIDSVILIAELSAKQLFGKDRNEANPVEGDFMRGRGTQDPSVNPNSYPMTDTLRYPSAVRIRVAGESEGVFDLWDDPADHRGILSWHSQKRDKKLREAGSYGYLISAVITKSALYAAAAAKEIILRLEVDETLPGGLAIYGEHFGRYPLDPTLVFTLKGR